MNSGEQAEAEIVPWTAMIASAGAGALFAIPGFWPVGAVFAIAGVAIQLTFQLVRRSRKNSAYLERYFEGSRAFDRLKSPRRYEIVQLNGNEHIPRIREIGRRSGEKAEDIPSAIQVRERLAHNPKLVFGVLEVAEDRRLVAAFIAYPLTRSAARKFDRAELTNASGLGPRYMRKSWITPAAVYIACIVAEDSDSADRVLAATTAFVDQASVPYLIRSDLKCSQRFIAEHAMIPIGRPSEVWKRG